MCYLENFYKMKSQVSRIFALSCGLSRRKYSCPRCHIGYCSVSCYQSNVHLECSELFYEEWVHEELKDCQPDPDARKRILEILRNSEDANSEENLDSDDEEAMPDLATRMMNVNLDDEGAVWEKLTVEEQQEFRKLVASGNIMKVLPEWEPWWKTKKRKAYVVDCDEGYDWQNKCPVVPSDIPELVKLTNVDPSPNVPFMLFNVLMSYAYTMRWFKGAHEELPVEALSTCVSLSATLRIGKVFKSVLEAFTAFEKDLSECKWVKAGYSLDLVHKDLIDIVSGANGNDLLFSLKAAVCDLDLLCSKTLAVLKEGKTYHLKRFSGPVPKKSLVQHVSRKMKYYLSWIASHGSSMLNIL